MTIEDIENDSVTQRRFADFQNTLKAYQEVFGSENSLRHYVFHAASNGLDKAISRLGKKLIFDLNKLDQWLAGGGAK